MVGRHKKEMAERGSSTKEAVLAAKQALADKQEKVSQEHVQRKGTRPFLSLSQLGKPSLFSRALRARLPLLPCVRSC